MQETAILESQVNEIPTVELFCGEKSFSKQAQGRGWGTFTLDSNKRFKPDYCVNLFNVDMARLPKGPSIVWASPPCTFFSTQSWAHHWNRDHSPKTLYASQAVKLVEKTIEVIQALSPVLWYIENPVGMMRHLPQMKELKRHTVTYCCYGDNRMKPTDIWSNDPGLTLTPPCGFKHNKRCPVTGNTNDLTTASQRSIIPPALINTILDSAANIIHRYRMGYRI